MATRGYDWTNFSANSFDFLVHISPTEVVGTSTRYTVLYKSLTVLALILARANATLDPALSNSEGRCPSSYSWQATIFRSYQISATLLTRNPAAPRPRFLKPSKQPSAHTILERPLLRPSLSSRPIINTTSLTARHTEHVKLTLVSLRLRWRVGRIAGRSFGRRGMEGMREWGQDVSEVRRMEGVDVSIAMGPLCREGMIASSGGWWKRNEPKAGLSADAA